MAETTNHFLDGPGLSRVWTKIKNLVSKKSVKSITRSGLKFTAKNESGETLFTFDQVDTDTTYSVATENASGLMSAANYNDLKSAFYRVDRDGVKLKFRKVSGEYQDVTIPTAGQYGLGVVKSDSTVTSKTGLTACPIISGAPYYKDTDTTYGVVTENDSGLMSPADYKDLQSAFYRVDRDGVKLMFQKVGGGHQDATIPTAGQSTLGVVKSDSTVTSKTGLTACPIIGGAPYYKNTTYSLVGEKNTTGLIKNGSSVNSTSNLIACPIIGGIPYYHDTTYPNASSTVAGLMSTSAFGKVSGLGKQQYTFTGNHFETTMDKTKSTWQFITGTDKYFDLDAGVWVLFATAIFPKNANLKRVGLSIGLATGDASSTVIRRDVREAESSGETWCHVVCPVVHSMKTKYAIGLRDSADIGPTVDVSITALRIC